MKILLVHLSDIHVKRDSDHVLDKANKIANAVRNLEHDLTACFVVISGDSAFSGAEEQYWAVLGLLQELRESLTSYSRTGAAVRFVVIPGNHDCDFGAANEVRDALVDAVEREQAAVPRAESRRPPGKGAAVVGLVYAGFVPCSVSSISMPTTSPSRPARS